MQNYLLDFLIIVIVLIIVTIIAGYFSMAWAREQARKEIAEIGERYGSIEVNGKWYVIKREGE